MSTSGPPPGPAQADPTTDPGLRSWVPEADASLFPIQSLPYGVFSRPGTRPRVGVAIGDHILDLAVVADAGLFGPSVEGALALFAADRLNPLMARGPRTWAAVRRRVSGLLRAGDRELADRGLADRALVGAGDARLRLPFAVADYVDFYSSLEHASTVGRLLRPGGAPLPPSWRHLPAGYHGRAGSVVVSGTPVVRPRGLFVVAGSQRPTFGPTGKLDYELELGVVVGAPSRLGRPVPVHAADAHAFGVVLVNDWSARDVQAFEYRPLGPFLGKAFATSVSAWVVPLSALAPYRVAPRRQEPLPAEHLRDARDGALDVRLEVALRSAGMAASGRPAAVVARTNARGLYWTYRQQIAHLTSGGARLRPGDLLASGTVSGDGPGSAGCLLEATADGSRPLGLPDGTERAWLADGDEVILRGTCGGDDGRPRIGLGEVRGTVLAASPG